MTHSSMRGLVLLLIAASLASVARGAEAIADTPFTQEYHEAYPVRLDSGAVIEDLRAIACGGDAVYVAAPKGAFALRNGHWNELPGGALGPTYTVKADGRGGVWVGSWDGLRHYSGDAVTKVAEINGPVTAIAVTEKGVIAMGPDGMWDQRSGAWQFVKKPWANSVRSLLVGRDDSVWIATAHGLFHYKDGAIAKHFFDELVYGELEAIAFSPDGKLWTAGMGGMTVLDGDSVVQRYDYRSKLPSIQLKTLAFAPDGVLWTGSDLGCARWMDQRWSLRHSRRWLVNDEVRGIAFDSTGTAWIATKTGVSAIKRRSMTLEQKAAELMQTVVARHIRPPGLVERCLLVKPGDVTSWKPMDTDNDGQYTSMYLAMQSLRYAVTKDPEALRLARQAFEGVAFLHDVTGKPGFIARSVVPIEWTQRADPNHAYTPEQLADERVSNPRWKNAEPRWRPSKDGKWMWKGDTSSDEVDGHLFGLYYFYKLAADETEKARVKRMIIEMVDYIVAGGYEFLDIDGVHTKWGVWSPQRLNGDPDWRSEAPLNKLEMLSFLWYAHELTGDAKYMEHVRTLVERHGYDSSTARPKPTAPSEQTHIDTFLLALMYPWLLESVHDDPLRAKCLEGHEYWYNCIKNDDNPFFTYVYAIHGAQTIDNGRCVAFLRDAPLDLIEWNVDNSARGDIELVHEPELWPPQTKPLVPPSERGVIRWDGNPFDVMRGAQGRTESSGVYWLLPYWMGRYYGHIAAPGP